MFQEVASDINALKNLAFTDYIPSSAWTSLSRIIEACLLREQSYGEDRPAEEADFVDFRKEVVYGLTEIFNFISKFVSSQSHQNFDCDSLVLTLILCGEHVSSELWSTEETQRWSALTVKTVCSFYDCESVTQLLLGQSPKFNTPCFKQALLLLRPKLLQETWRKHPGAVASYQWLLFQVRSPHLSEYLDVVSPTVLIILDDHDVARRLIGLNCMFHILDNVARTELCRRGLHQVFYKTLEPMLWQRTASQVEPVITCLTKLLSLTERGYTRSTEPGMWDLFDETISCLLDKMVIEDQIPLRVAYIKSLAPFISAMGPSVIRWHRRLSSVLEEYLCKESFDTRKYALEAMKIYISLTEVRMPQNGDSCLSTLLRTLLDITSEEDPGFKDAELLHKVKDCIISVRQGAPSEFQSISQELETLECNSVMKEILSECVSFNE